MIIAASSAPLVIRDSELPALPQVVVTMQGQQLLLANAKPDQCREERCEFELQMLLKGHDSTWLEDDHVQSHSWNQSLSACVGRQRGSVQSAPGHGHLEDRAQGDDLVID